jgi:Uma2 family endonuclease
MVATRLMTADELAQLPDDGYRYELIEGELIRMPPAGWLHGVRLLEVGLYVLDYAKRHGGRATGGSGYRLKVDPDTVLAPDVAYVRSERIPPNSGPTYPPVAPDVALEIVSPSERPGYQRKKVRVYFEAGTRMVLFLDEMKRTLTVEHADGHTEVLHEGDVFDGGEVMPGFRVPVADLFR